MQEFTLVVGEAGQIVIIDSDGEPVSDKIGYRIGMRLCEHYERKDYVIYFAQSRSERDLFKVGISRDAHRREREIEGVIVHSIRCSSKWVRRMEVFLHRILQPYAIGHEWFRLGEHGGARLVEYFQAHIKTQLDLIDLFDHLPMKLFKRMPIEWFYLHESLSKQWRHPDSPKAKLPRWVTGEQEPSRPMPLSTVNEVKSQEKAAK